MPFTTIKRKARARLTRRPACPIPQWRKRIALAFTLPPEEPDPDALAVAEALRALRHENAMALGVLRQAFAAGRACPAMTANALSDEAERCVGVALEIVLGAMERRRGPAPGRCAVLALGNLGGREFRFGSDLDLVFTFERDAPDYCAHAAAWFEEAARELVGALSHHPDLGALYEVDMRLRPHGGDGVLAVERQAFAAYYLETCWTWELQAITRTRVVAGDADVGEAVMQAAREAVGHRRGRSPDEVMADVREMRALLEEEHPAACAWDVKRAAGGLIDIEFIAQAMQLALAQGQPLLPHPSTPEALDRLAACGLLCADDARELTRAWWLQLLVLQHQRAMGVEPAALAEQPAARLEGLLEMATAPSMASLGDELAAAQRGARALFDILVRGGSVEAARIAA